MSFSWNKILNTLAVIGGGIAATVAAIATAGVPTSHAMVVVATVAGTAGTVAGTLAKSAAPSLHEPKSP